MGWGVGGGGEMGGGREVGGKEEGREGRVSAEALLPLNLHQQHAPRSFSITAIDPNISDGSALLFQHYHTEKSRAGPARCGNHNDGALEELLCAREGRAGYG